MNKVAEYRNYARECRTLAQRAQSSEPIASIEVELLTWIELTSTKKARILGGSSGYHGTRGYAHLGRGIGRFLGEYRGRGSIGRRIGPGALGFWGRARPFLNFTVERFRRFSVHVQEYCRYLSGHRSCYVLSARGVLGRPATYKMDRPTHARSVFPRQRAWVCRVGVCDRAECKRSCGSGDTYCKRCRLWCRTRGCAGRAKRS